MSKTSPSIVLLFLSAALGCGDGAEPEASPWEWDLPEHVPEPRVPEDNPMSEAKVELGRFLFYDKRLSGNQTQSCSSCHKQELAFTDGAPVSEGSTGELTPRSSMSIANSAYAATLTWANNNLVRLEDQARVPLFGEVPVELGLADMEDELLRRMREDERYPRMFAEAFPEEGDPISVGSIVKALAAFQRSVTSFDSKVDRWSLGDETALNASEQNGMRLFFGGETEAGVPDALECFHCHGGFLYSQSVDEAQNVFDQSLFVNNGLYNLDAQGSYPPGNEGLFDITGERVDKGAFKPPSLRNIALTAPYMHDGSIETLEEVVRHYERGGRLIEDGPYAGDGFDNPNKNGFLQGFVLSEQERQDLLAFLRALTDESLLSNPAYSDPFAE